MRSDNVKVLFCCMLLSLNTPIDAYGLSVQRGKNSRKANAVKQRKMLTEKVTPASDHKNIKVDTPTPGSQIRERAPELIKPDTKLLYEINELNRMLQQLTTEIANDPTNLRKLRMQKDIEQQLKVRKMQQSSIGESKRLLTPFPSPVLTGGSQRTFTSKSGPQQFRSIIQQGAGHVMHPQRLIHQHQLRRINGINTSLQQIPTGHILVPVSSLSSSGILNNRDILANRFMVVKTLRHNNLMPAIPIITSRNATRIKTKLPARLLTSTSTSTLPTTTVAASVSTAMSDFELATKSGARKLKDKYLNDKIEKQQLEIRKLRLEIRALESQNQPEIEYEDMVQHTTPLK